jgi:FAD-dependent urate hydroxylase
MILDIIIVGAGPYGLSLAAHAQASGLSYELIGFPMEFWYKKMPPEMFIRTKLQNTGLSDPNNSFTLERFSKEGGIALDYPLTRRTFVEYGFWFIYKTGINVTEDYVTSISKNEDIFQIHTSNGREIYSKNVVIAVGLTNARYVPENLTHLPSSLVTHSSDHINFHSFKGRNVLVLGGGQSAWEVAALLHEAAANVKLVYRSPMRLSSDKETNERQKYFADKFYFMNEVEKEKIHLELRKPTVADFLVPLVEGKVQKFPNTRIKEVLQTDNGKLQVFFQKDDIVVDHLIAATGFKYSLYKLSFLNPILTLLETEVDDKPKVDKNFQSTISGLYFAGPATAFSHGPTFLFIAGVWHTSKTIISSIGN